MIDLKKERKKEQKKRVHYISLQLDKYVDEIDGPCRVILSADTNETHVHDDRVWNVTRFDWERHDEIDPFGPLFFPIVWHWGYTEF